MTDVVALLFGAVIVIFFSYERFNRTTDEAGQQMLRLAKLLSPDKLRSRGVVTNAYFFYAATFVVIYLFLCAYAQLIPALGGPNIPVGATKLPVLEQSAVVKVNPTTGFTAASEGDVSDFAMIQPPDASVDRAPRQGNYDIGIGAATSLAVALMIVGLAPAFPILQDVEAWIRGAAHRLAGIPTRVIAIRDDLRSRSIGIFPPEETNAKQTPFDRLMIPRGDWNRLERYQELSLTSRLDSRDDFLNDMALIFAVSAWLIDRKLSFPKLQQRERFTPLEKELNERAEALIDALDDKTSSSKPTSREAEGRSDEKAIRAQPATDGLAMMQGGDKPPGDERLSASDDLRSWNRLAKQADDLADDMCILLALYIEHDIISPASFVGLGDKDQAGGTSNAVGGNATVARSRDAMRKLRTFLNGYVSDEAMSASVHADVTIIGLWTFFLILAVTVVWSQYPGQFETILKDGADPGAYGRLGAYTLTAFIAYSIPMTVGLAIRDGANHIHRWRNTRQSAWTHVLPQAAVILVASWMVATLVMIALFFWFGRVEEGLAENRETLLAALQRAFDYNAPTVARGALLALIVVTIIDDWEAPRAAKPHRGWSLIWGLRAALIMAVIGAVTRLFTTWAGAMHASVPRQSLDAIDRGLIAYTAIYSAILGFVIAFCVCEVLMNRRYLPEKRARRPGGEDRTSAGSPR
jgi:hypothetical protein